MLALEVSQAELPSPLHIADRKCCWAGLGRGKYWTCEQPSEGPGRGEEQFRFSVHHWEVGLLFGTFRF